MFANLRDKLFRTRNAFRKVEDLFQSGKRREEILDGLEEALILADVGVAASGRVQLFFRLHPQANINAGRCFRS